MYVCNFLLLEGNKYYYVVCVYTYLLFVNVFIKSVVPVLRTTRYRYTCIPWCAQAHFSTTLTLDFEFPYYKNNQQCTSSKAHRMYSQLIVSYIFLFLVVD